MTWLLDSDPAIRWQALQCQGLTSVSDIARERARVATEGLGARILAAQGADGAWHIEGKPDWLPTLFTMILLRATGVEPGAVASALDRLEGGYRWYEEHGGKSFFGGEVEPCINGGVLACGGYFGRPDHELAQRLLAEQLADGGWNCDAPKSQRSSFHTTICVLEGLLEYERATGITTDAARRRGEEYLLARSLFRRQSTRAVVLPEVLQLAFPPRYHYDILRALDYFRAANRAPEPRMADAIAILEGRAVDECWPLDQAYEEAIAVTTGEVVGEPSRWNTLRALRVLRWYRGR